MNHRRETFADDSFWRFSFLLSISSTFLRFLSLEHSQLFTNDGAALHHKPNLADRRNIARRVAFDRDQIRQKPSLHSSDLVVQMQYRALVEVADRKASTGCIPNLTIASSSRALSP